MANPNGCKCVHCTNHDLYRWATIMECKCICHDDPHPLGHDGLCCSYPNGKRKDNPYSDLKPASEYKKILDEWEREANAL